MEKYYDLIISLVKANRRYPGCEDILDDIVEDIYAHAEVVLNSVSNESVISSYLNKIVSTSMITVPRKLGIENHPAGRIDSANKSENLISKIEQQQAERDLLEMADAETDDADTDTEEETTEEYNLEFDTDDNSDEINIAEEEEEEEEEEYNLSASTEDELTPAINEEEIDIDTSSDELLPDGENDAAELNEFVVEKEDDNTAEELVFEDDSEPLEEPEAAPVPDVDKTLVDKMINGLPSDEYELEETSETDGLLIADSTGDDLLEGDFEDYELLQPEIQTNKEELDSNAPTENEIEEVYEIASDDISDKEEEEEEEENADSVISPYKYFDFEPQKKENDYSEILPEIEELDANNPELNISEIFKLKYQKKFSVSDIAEELSLSNEAVLDALNKLMYIVKE